MTTLTMKKIGRNDPCACGSGKKYKQCCMDADLVSSTAIQAQQRNMDALMVEGKALHQQGQLAQAQANYEAVLQQHPTHPDALHYLGVLAYQAKNYPVAEELMRASINQDDGNPFYYSNLGSLYRDQKKLSKAIECQQRALALKPDYAEAYLNLAAAQIDQRQVEQGIASCLKALELRPQYVEALDNLGTALRLQLKFAEAALVHQKAIAINPNYVGSYVNLAAAQLYLKRFDDVSQNCLLALKLNPNNASAYYYLGAACMEQGQVQASQQFLQHSLALDNNPNTHFTLAILLLGTGQFVAGWLEHEYRFVHKVDPVLKRYYPFPEWQGESLAEKTILVWFEQGIGDQIAYASMVDDMLTRSKNCVLACTKKLVPLYKQSFPTARVMEFDDPTLLEPQTADVQMAAGSLGRWLRPDYASFDRTKPILSADWQRVSYWKQRLATMGDSIKVGICWRSGNITGDRALYCTELAEWGAILSVPGVTFINLQYDDCHAELDAAYQQFGVRIHAFPEVDLYDDLLEAAALTSALDLVISAPTAAAILAGALDVPTWMMLTGFDWQRRNANGNIFYRSMQTFNKSWDENWAGMIETIAAQLNSVRKSL